MLKLYWQCSKENVHEPTWFTQKKKQREMAVPIYNLTEMQVIIVFYDR